MAGCVIYGYAKPNGKIVYVGQTNQLRTRNKKHMEYDPNNPNVCEYNYPLSRGIRKYGKDYYSLVILEKDISPDELDSHERYWIEYFDTYWHGYNQTPGGKQIYGPRALYTEQAVEKTIDLLKNTTMSFQQIKEITGMSITHIYNINIGERRFRKDIEYPIRSSKAVGTKGIIFSQEQILQIHKALAEPNASISKIAQSFNCCTNTISRINSGKTQRYRLADWHYPIFDTSCWSHK